MVTCGINYVLYNSVVSKICISFRSLIIFDTDPADHLNRNTAASQAESHGRIWGFWCRLKRWISRFGAPIATSTVLMRSRNPGQNPCHEKDPVSGTGFHPYHLPLVLKHRHFSYIFRGWYAVRYRHEHPVQAHDDLLDLTIVFQHPSTTNPQ